MYGLRNAIQLLLGICLIIAPLPPRSSAVFTWICGERPLHDKKIDLKEIETEKNFAKTIKYTMIIYGRSTADIMNILRSEIASLVELETVDTSKGFFGGTSKAKEQNVARISVNLVKNFRNYLKSSGKRLSYVQKAFHYKALRWVTHTLELESNTALKDLKAYNSSSYFTDGFNEKRIDCAILADLNSGNEVDNVKGDPAVAEEYLHDLLPDLDPLVDAKSLDEERSTIKDLKSLANKRQDKIVETFQAIQSCGISCLQSDSNHLFEQQLYKHILQDSNPEKFKEKFTYEPHQMLMYMDYGFNIIKNNSAIFQRIPDTELNKINICLGNYRYLTHTAEKFKYALLFYYQVLDEKFWQPIEPQNEIYDLIFRPTNFGMKPSEGSAKETYSETYKLLTYDLAGYPRDMRLKSLATLYLGILHEADVRMVILKYHSPDPKTDRSGLVYDKLLEWLSNIIPKESQERNPDEQPTSEEELKDFKAFQKVVDYIKKIRDREARNNKLTRVTMKYTFRRAMCDLKDLRYEVNDILTQELRPDAATEDGGEEVVMQPRDIPGPFNIDSGNSIKDADGLVETSAKPSSSKLDDRSDAFQDHSRSGTLEYDSSKLGDKCRTLRGSFDTIEYSLVKLNSSGIPNRQPILQIDGRQQQAQPRVSSSKIDHSADPYDSESVSQGFPSNLYAGEYVEEVLSNSDPPSTGLTTGHTKSRDEGSGS